ncbi:hypothetical protein ABPG72_008204, partial [Tetrahymena utriculariae]
VKYNKEGCSINPLQSSTHQASLITARCANVNGEVQEKSKSGLVTKGERFFQNVGSPFRMKQQVQLKPAASTKIRSFHCSTKISSFHSKINSLHSKISSFHSKIISFNSKISSFHQKHLNGSLESSQMAPKKTPAAVAEKKVKNLHLNQQLPLKTHLSSCQQTTQDQRILKRA